MHSRSEPQRARLKPLAAAFLAFALLSGVGWLLDFMTFTALVKLGGVAPFAANVASSYVGVTFVWFASLRSVFGRTGGARGRFLAIYWGYQLASILLYSQLLYLLAQALPPTALWVALAGGAGVAAKIIVTPFNLMTNFVFMKFLTRFMRSHGAPDA